MKNEILKSWELNASEWIKVINEGEIASRKHTNRAILRTLGNLPIKKILDVGCGEGWLTRSLTSRGKIAVGTDAIETLLKDARTKGPETFYQISYEEIIRGIKIPEAPYDAVVCNFCLYQNNGLDQLLIKLREALTNNGYMVIQTLHPFFIMESHLEYKSQWINDSWKGLPGKFKEGHPWYARIFSDWIALFNKGSLNLFGLEEVTNHQNKPISLIFVLR